MAVAVAVDHRDGVAHLLWNRWRAVEVEGRKLMVEICGFGGRILIQEGNFFVVFGAGQFCLIQEAVQFNKILVEREREVGDVGCWPLYYKRVYLSFRSFS